MAPVIVVEAGEHRTAVSRRRGRLAGGETQAIGADRPSAVTDALHAPAPALFADRFVRGHAFHGHRRVSPSILDSGVAPFSLNSTRSGRGW
jgi:hypothetical protein